MGLKTWLGIRKPPQPSPPQPSPPQPSPPPPPDPLPQAPFAPAFGHLRSFSQLQQDFWVLSETGNLRGGVFVEIGAFDGITLSNTYLLEKEFGWTGLLAEPNPLFSESIRSIRRAQLCTSPIDDVSGKEVTMLFVPGAPEFSAMADNAYSDIHAERREINEEVQQTTISLNDFLGQFDAPRQIDFMSIDTEGNELNILSTFDFNRYAVRLFCVEHNWTGAEADIDRIMNSRGYERVHREWSKWDAWYRRR